MNTQYFKEYSHNLGRDMEFKVYGSDGKPVLAFPSQSGRFYDFENNGMIDCIKDYIEAGRIQVFCCDCNDDNSWSSMNPDQRARIEAQEAYVRYITEELVPRIMEISPDGRMPLTTGCSMGGTHALNFLLRRPDLFSGCIALSGAYNARFFFPDYFDDLAARMKELFSYKNIPAWVDFWGYDVAHDWPWWRKQLPYFMAYVC